MGERGGGREGIETDSLHLDSLPKEKITSQPVAGTERHKQGPRRRTPQIHNQGRLEHFKDKHVFSCGLIKLKVDASDAGARPPELPGN